MTSNPIVYIAGKYNDGADWRIAHNVIDAAKLSMLVWSNEMVAVCPHLNTAFMGGWVPEQEFLAGYLTLLERCDALLTVNNWRNSKGATKEVEFAKQCDIPVFHDIHKLVRWRHGDE